MRRLRPGARRKSTVRARRSKKAAVPELNGVAGKKRFKSASGRYAQVAVLDANAATFGTELLKVFRENVTRAREENMRLFGSPDRAPEDR